MKANFNRKQRREQQFGVNKHQRRLVKLIRKLGRMMRSGFRTRSLNRQADRITKHRKKVWQHRSAQPVT